MAAEERPLGIGARIAPPRFLAFVALYLLGATAGTRMIGWRAGSMASFDIAAPIFLAINAPLLRSKADEMREAATRNDANRVLLLVITGIVSLVVLVAVAAELSEQGRPEPAMVALVIATLALSWMFSNFVYALHYAHLFYSRRAGGGDEGGIAFPGTSEPDYWDFIYFASCLGMTFQTSDVSIDSSHIRRVVTFHCLAAFVFNLGILAFSINVLGDG